MSIFTLFSKEDYLTYKQQQDLINSSAINSVYALLNINLQGPVHLSLKKGLLVTLPEGFGPVELTKYATADTILGSDSIVSLVKDNKLDFITEQSYFRSINREISQEEKVVNPLVVETTAEIKTEILESTEEYSNDAEDLKEIPDDVSLGLEDLSIDELKALCTEKGISFSHNSKKETLIKKLADEVSVD